MNKTTKTATATATAVVELKKGKMDFYQGNDAFKALIADFGTKIRKNASETLSHQADIKAVQAKMVAVKAISDIMTEEETAEKLAKLEAQLEAIKLQSVSPARIEITETMKTLWTQYATYVKALKTSDAEPESLKEYEWYVGSLRYFLSGYDVDLTTIGFKMINEAMGLKRASTKDRADGIMLSAISKQNYFYNLFGLFYENMVRVGAIAANTASANDK